MQHWFWKMSFVFVSTLLAIYAGESLARWYYTQHAMELSYGKSITNPDDRLAFSFPPNKNIPVVGDGGRYSIHINNLGFRGQEDISVQKSPSTYRILMAGDSFTYGSELPDTATIPYVTGKRLSEITGSGKNVEVINMGVPGYSPDQTYRQLQFYIPNLNPDLVIWNFNSWDIGGLVNNQGQSFYRASLYGVKNGELVPRDARFNKIYLANAVFAYAPKVFHTSYLLDMIVRGLFTTPMLSGIPSGTLTARLSWAQSKLYLEIQSIHAAAEGNNSDFIFVLQPTKETLDGSLAADYRGFISELKKRLSGQPITLVDLNEDASGATVNKSVLGVSSVDFERLFYSDGHPNVTGARIFASALSSIISEYIR